MPDDDEPEALSMAWPSGTKDRITYLLVAPIIFPLWLTLPDTRTPRGKRFFPITFIGSILWIAAYSYLMVWWANVAGDTAEIPPEVSYIEGILNRNVELKNHVIAIKLLFGFCISNSEQRKLVTCKYDT